MRRRRGTLFSKLGLLVMAILLALGSMGLVYSGWTDTVTVSGTISTADNSLTLSILDLDPAQSDGYNTWISGYVSGIELHLHVQNAQGPGSVIYYCQFQLENTGTLPMTVQTVNVIGLPGDAYLQFNGGTCPLGGITLDPGEVETCPVHIWLDSGSGPSVGTNFDVTVALTAGLWSGLE